MTPMHLTSSSRKAPCNPVSVRFFTNVTKALLFGLDRDGDTLILIDPQGHRIDAVTFGSQWTDHSLSQDDDGLHGPWGCPPPGLPTNPPPWRRSSLRLNEIMASPLPGEPDWLEWVNGHPNLLPLALEGLHLRLNQALVALPPHSFLGPQQVRLMEADGSPNPSTLGGASAGSGCRPRVAGCAGAGDRSAHLRAPGGGPFLRAPAHATGGFQSLGLQAAPGSPATSGRVLSCNCMKAARHQRGVYPGMEGTPDWIELHNPTNARVDLGGVQIGVDGDRWALPEGAFIEAGAYRVLWLDGEDLVERSGFEGWVLPQALPGQGATLELLHPDGRLLDRLTYGIQLPDQSIGRVGGQWACYPAPLRDKPTHRLPPWILPKACVSTNGRAGQGLTGWSSITPDPSPWPSRG